MNQSSYSLYQSGSACDLWTVEFSGQREGCFDFNDQDISLVKKGHSHGSVIVDPWFPRELILQYCVSSSLGVLPSSLKVPSLHAFDTLEPEIAASASRLICFFKYEKEALESLLLDCFETAEGGDEDEGSAAGFRATKCDAEAQRQFGGNDGCLKISGPIVDQTSLSGMNRAEISVWNLHLAELGHEKTTTTFKAMSECLIWPTNAAHVPSANGSTKSYREIRSMLDAPAAAEYFEDQLPPVAPLDVSLPLLHPCCGCVAVTLSLSLFCSLFIGWLRLIAMDGRSIDLAAHQKGTFFSIGN